MRSYRLTLPFIALFVILSCFSCSKYKDAFAPSQELPEDKLVTASVQGRVLDEKGVPVQGAQVTSNMASTTTDVNGTFFFKDISLYSRFGTVNVSYQGHFMGSRTFVTSTTALNFIEIHLLPKTSSGTFDASAGGTISLTGGQSVVFSGGSIVNAATNVLYSGSVHVYAAYLDPTKRETYMTMPGDLRGITTDKKEVVLGSYGMMKVELEGDGGEKLQIASGKTAELTFAIPGDLQTEAPDTIPLWHFADSTGKWMQEGKASKKGNAYVGQVSHFSWWNCDIFYYGVMFTAKVKDQNGRALADRWVMFSGSANTASGQTKGVIFLSKTDSAGVIKDFLPVSQVLPLRIEDMCGNIIGGANVGPLLANTDFGTIIVQLDDVMLNLSGDVVDCSSSPLKDGFISVYVDNLTYRAAVANGKFSMAIHRCNSVPAQAQFIAVDNTGGQQGDATTLSVTKGDVNVGQLTACGVTTDEFINLHINGHTYSFANPPDAFSYYESGDITAYSSDPVYKWLDIFLPQSPINGTGTYTPSLLAVYHGDFRGGSRPDQSVTATMNVTDFGPVNGFIKGTFGGNITDSTNMQVYPLSGNFKIKRAN